MVVRVLNMVVRVVETTSGSAARTQRVCAVLGSVTGLLSTGVALALVLRS